MRTISIIQGSAGWHEHRANSRNASEASIIMGASPHKTRTQLLDEKTTGIAPEVDAATQRRFDEGHRVEALMRAMCEEDIGESLFPIVATDDDGYLSASFDGVTLLEDVIFEAKLANKGKMYDVARNVIPESDLWQLVQQFMVCENAQFLHYYVGDGTKDGTVKMVLDRVRMSEYFSRLYSEWLQWDKDLKDHQPEPKAAPVVATPQEALPAVSVRVDGALQITDNLDLFGQALRSFVDTIPQRPETDQNFADCEAACKTLKKAEDALAAAEDNALAQISDVEQMRRAVADLRNLARDTRLATEKLVRAEKENRKRQLVMDAQAELDRYVDVLNEQLEKPWIGRVRPPFGDAIKGLKSLDSMADKLSVALAEAKGQAHELAQAYERNRDALKTNEQDWIMLFADFRDVGVKAAEDFDALMQLRITQHKHAEAERLEAERARIRAEEERRAQAATEAERQRIAAEERAKAQAEAALAAAQEKQEDADAGPTASKGPDHSIAELGTPAPGGVFAETTATPTPKSSNQAPDAAQQAPAPAIQAAAPAAPEIDNEPTLNLSAINARLAPLSISGAGMAKLGIEPLANDKNARLFSEEQFGKLLVAIGVHIARLAQEQMEAAEQLEAA